jgi:RNA polymerase II C-terminal domain phosphatase-like 1/2
MFLNLYVQVENQVYFCSASFIQEALSASSTVTNLDSRLAPAPQYTAGLASSSIPLPTTQASMMQFPNIQFPQPASLGKPLGHVGPPEPSLQSSPAREEGEVPESELDPDTRRRLLILQHGQDTRDHASTEPPFPVRPPIQVPGPRVQSRSGWFPVEEEMSPPQLSRTVPKEFPLDSEPMHIEKHGPHPSFFPKVESSITSDRVLHENQRLPKEVIVT